MTPKEKAADLIDDFQSKIGMTHSSWNKEVENSFPMPLKFSRKIAVESALRAVNEIIETIAEIEPNTPLHDGKKWVHPTVIGVIGHGDNC